MPRNVVLIVLDDCPSDWNDYIPYMSSQPEGKWVYFPVAHNTMPQCASCRATLFTGQYTARHGVKHNNIALGQVHAGLDGDTLLAPTLQRAGYTTGLFGKYLNGYPWYDANLLNEGETPNDLLWTPPGWNEWMSFRTNNGSGDYFGFHMIERSGLGGAITQVAYDETKYSTDVISAAAVDFVESAAEPFFAHVAYWGPHDPAEPAPRHADLYADIDPADNRSVSWNEADISDKPAWYIDNFEHHNKPDAAELAAYDAERKQMWRAIKSIDEGAQDIIEALDARGILENTVIIWMNDNGHLLGEHRFRAKPMPFDECSRMSLRIRYPPGEQGTNDALVGNIDIAPTIADIAGTRMPDPDGMSLVPLLDGTLDADSWREHLMIEQQPITTWRACYGIRSRIDKYVDWYLGVPSPETSYYDLVADPYEMMASKTEHGGLAPLLAALHRELGVTADLTD